MVGRRQAGVVAAGLLGHPQPLFVLPGEGELHVAVGGDPARQQRQPQQPTHHCTDSLPGDTQYNIYFSHFYLYYLFRIKNDEK